MSRWQKTYLHFIVSENKLHCWFYSCLFTYLSHFDWGCWTQRYLKFLNVLRRRGISRCGFLLLSVMQCKLVISFLKGQMMKIRRWARYGGLLLISPRERKRSFGETLNENIYNEKSILHGYLSLKLSIIKWICWLIIKQELFVLKR